MPAPIGIKKPAASNSMKAPAIVLPPGLPTADKHIPDGGVIPGGKISIPTGIGKVVPGGKGKAGKGKGKAKGGKGKGKKTLISRSMRAGLQVHFGFLFYMVHRFILYGALLYYMVHFDMLYGPL